MSQLPRKLAPKLSNLGARRNPSRAPHELIELKYVPGDDPLRDVLFGKLQGQERAILEILLSDTERIWTKARVDELVLASKDKLNSTQDPVKVLNYYRGRLIEKGFLKRVKFSEYRGPSLAHQE